MKKFKLKYTRQKLMELQREIDKDSTIVGDFNISLLVIDISNRQKNLKKSVKI